MVNLLIPIIEWMLQKYSYIIQESCSLSHIMQNIFACILFVVCSFLFTETGFIANSLISSIGVLGAWYVSMISIDYTINGRKGDKDKLDLITNALLVGKMLINAAKFSVDCNVLLTADIVSRRAGILLYLLLRISESTLVSIIFSFPWIIENYYVQYSSKEANFPGILICMMGAGSVYVGILV